MKQTENDIPAIAEMLARKHGFAIIRPVDMGWSDDIKYYAQDSAGGEFLLRVSDISKKERKLNELDFLSKLADHDINISRPVFHAELDGRYFYLVLTWVGGDDLEYTVDRFTPEQQYRLGFEAGRILRAIHSVKPSGEGSDWFDVFSPKLDRIIERYRNCEVQFEYGDHIIGFINDNRRLLRGREYTFQHGDYHIGNFVVTQNLDLGVIDFNRCSFGDPLEEYDRFVFTWRRSRQFARGQLDAYFEGRPDEESFRLMLLYAAKNTLASLPWAIPFGEKEVGVMIENADLNFRAYNGFASCVPDWYNDLPE